MEIDGPVGSISRSRDVPLSLRETFDLLTDKGVRNQNDKGRGGRVVVLRKFRVTVAESTLRTDLRAQRLIVVTGASRNVSSIKVGG